jgi:hypothetical protein
VSTLSPQPLRSANTGPGYVCRNLFAGHVLAAEVMAVRPEDIDAQQDQRAFADGATLAELEQYIAFLRSLGAPDDAHPKVGVSDDYEVTLMICVVERGAVHLQDAS